MTQWFRVRLLNEDERGAWADGATKAEARSTALQYFRSSFGSAKVVKEEVERIPAPIVFAAK